LTSTVAKRYLSSHLVFGKAVRFRHYPVTVTLRDRHLKPLGRVLWEGCSILMKRKSGDRPDTILGLFNFDGRVEEHGRRIHNSRVTRLLPMGHFPRGL
jgi:hypothetical protein